MKDDIHNTVLVDSKKDKAVLQSLGDIKKALSDNKKGVKVFNKICYNFGPYLNSVVACLGTILHISTACISQCKALTSPPPLPATPAHGILIFTEWFVKIPSPPARAKGAFKCPILYFCKRQNQCPWLSIYWPTFEVWGVTEGIALWWRYES